VSHDTPGDASRVTPAAALGRQPAPARPEVAWDQAERTLALLSGKWVLRVLRALHDVGSQRHNQLLREVGNAVSARSLDATLRRMEAAGLVDRQVQPGSPPAVFYQMTALARSLTGPLAALGRWGAAHEHQLQPRHRPGNPAA
jgi:DNA-binding HxlR family transcriptional regulator